MSATEDVRLTLSTRTSWARFVPAALDSEKTTSQMIELGSSEFVRFRGVRTVEVLVQAATGSRLMVWRGAEEIAPIEPTADNPADVKSRERA